MEKGKNKKPGEVVQDRRRGGKGGGRGQLNDNKKKSSHGTACKTRKKKKEVRPRGRSASGRRNEKKEGIAW